MTNKTHKLSCLFSGHRWVQRSQPNHVVLPTCLRCGKVDEADHRMPSFSAFA